MNVDASTMNLYQQGEVFVTEDGAETDRSEKIAAAGRMNAARSPMWTS